MVLPPLPSAETLLPRPKRITLASPLVVLCLLGCSTYPERTARALDDFQRGHLLSAEEAFADSDVVESPFLSGAEAGTVALTRGDWEAALEHLSRAAGVVEELEGRALAGPDRLADSLSTWVLNDTSREYQGEGFERVYLHASLAMAYLAKGALDDVYVEARLANQLLEAEEELYETEYKAGGVGHFVSALAYELLGEPDQAYIDYERMEAKGVGTALAGRALVRLATDLHRDDDLERWEERYGAAEPRPDGAANVVVLAGVGLAPYKVESRVGLQTRDALFAMAVPSFRHRFQGVSGLRLDVDAGAGAVVTDVIESVSEVATKNLEDRLAWIAVKSAARGAMKAALTKELEDEYDLGGRIVGDLFAFLTERADLRSWSTLPDSWQAARVFVTPGVHGFRLDALGGESLELGAYELEEGETLLILARTVAGRVHAHVIGGVPVEAPTPARP